MKAGAEGALDRVMNRREMLRSSVLGVAGLAATSSFLVACGESGSGPGGGSGGATAITEFNSLGGDTFINAMTYIAMDQGFFKDEGLDYNIEYVEGTVRTIQTIVGGKTGAGWTDVFGQLVAVAGGFKVKSLFQTYTGAGFGEYVLQKSPINAFEADQVRGKKIGITAPDGGEVPGLLGTLARMGFKKNADYKMVTVGTGPPEIADALESGRVDVMAMSALDAENIKNKGVRFKEVTPDYVLKFPGHTYFTTPQLLEDKGDVMRKFLRARAKALVWMRANPTGAGALGIKYAKASAEGLSPKQASGFLKAFWLRQNEIYFDESLPTFHKIGLQDPASWDAYQKFLIEGAVSADGEGLSEPLKVGDIVDNSMIDFANDFDYAEVEAAAKRFKV